jgi:RNA polymerase sigma factor (sigma-70 family)
MGIMRSRADPSGLSDSELIHRSRSGDRDAFGELWRRHSRAGVTVARSYTSTFDPEDLVAESYAKIFQAIQSGGGPTGAFRPYLFTTIRNTAASWGRAKRETAIEDADQIEDPQFSEENTLAALDRSLTARAFQSLPTRWQEALWYSEVESMTPQEIAPLLGMKANAVAALTYRAREGLRQAWIQAHLSSLPADSECRWSIDHLGAYARDGLSKRDTARVDHHLSGCAKCTIVAAEAKEVGSRLTLVLLPLAAGLAGATGYTAWLQSGSHAAAYAMGAGGAVMPAAAVSGVAGGSAAGGGAGSAGAGSAGAGGAGGSAGAGGASGAGASAAAGSGVAAGAAAGGVSGVVIGTVVTGVLVAAAAVTAIVMAPMVFNNTPTAPKSEAAPPAAVSTPAPDSTSTSPSPPPTVTPTSPAVPPADSAPDDASPGVPVSLEPDSPAMPPVADSPASPDVPSAPSIADASVSPAGVLTLVGSGEPGNTVVATAQSMGGGGGGTARLAVVPSGLEVGRTTVDSSGAWTLATDLSATLPNGIYTFTVVQSGASGDSAPTTTAALTLSVVPAAPSISTPAVGDPPISSRTALRIDGTGVAGNSVEASLAPIDGEPAATAHGTVAPDGKWAVDISLASVSNGTYALSVVQINDAGPSAAAERTVVIAIPPDAPEITNVETGGGYYYPIVSGTGVPDATVIVVAADGQRSDPINVNADGTWTSPQLDWVTTSVAATQTYDALTSHRSVPRTVAIDVPPVASYVLTGWAYSDLGWGDGFTLTVNGDSGASFSALGDDEQFYHGSLDDRGAYSAGWVWVGAGTGEHTISVRYDNGLSGSELRYGPSSAITFQAPGTASAATTPALRATRQSAGVVPAAR